MRLAKGLDEVKRRKKELSRPRSDFDAFRRRARTEWANRKILDLKKSRTCTRSQGNLSDAQGDWSECGKTLSAKGREFCLTDEAAEHLETRGKDNTVGMGDFASQRHNKPQIGSTICQMPDLAPSTDEITKTLIVAGGEDAMDLTVSLIQTLVETDHKPWEEAVSNIEVCMLYKGKGSGRLPQNQCFIMLIAFGLRVIAKTAARRLTRHAEENALVVNEQQGFRSKHSVLGPVLTLCIEDAVRAKVNPADDLFTSIVADIAKAYPRFPRRDDDGNSGKNWRAIEVLKHCHARYRIKNSEGHNRKWFKMSLGLKRGLSGSTHRIFDLPLLLHERSESSLDGKPGWQSSCWIQF